MSHPMQEHKGYRVERERVSHIAGKHEEHRPIHRARGGSVHSDEAEDKSLIKKSVKKSCMRADGGAVKARSDKTPRRAKGGRMKHGKGSKTNVNVIVAPGGGHPPMAGLGAMPPGMPPPGAAPPMPPRPPMPPAPGGPPMAVPGPGGMPMRARGGKVSSADIKGKTGIGTRTPIQHSGNKSDTQNIGRGPVVTRKTGGAIDSSKAKMGPTFPHKAGAGSGIARKAKAHMAHDGKAP